MLNLCAFYKASILQLCVVKKLPRQHCQVPYPTHLVIMVAILKTQNCTEQLKITLSTLCILCFYFYITSEPISSTHVSSLESCKVGLYTLRNIFWKPFLSVTRTTKSNSLWIIILLLSGDIEVNPGPETKWPCGICQYPVTWSQEGVACDGCELWHHKSCISLCSDDFQLLERSNVAWKCCKCDSINCDTFTFHSFELQTSNSFYPLTFESTIDSIQSQTFSPLHTSSPRTSTKPSNRSNISQSVHRSARNKYSSTDTSDSPYELPKKQNIRILNVNCRSVKEKNSEFKAALEYIKPDIICGTESWLRGKKPGKQYNKNAILNSEIFPDSFNVFRNDRSTRGGGVFVAVRSNLTAVECVDFITDCELDLVKISLKGKQELFVGSYYMPKRNMTDLNNLRQSLELLNKSKPKHLVLCGDFNCPDIDWDKLCLKNSKSIQDRNEQQYLIEIMSEFNLTQVHDQPTREENLLDLVFTTNPSLIKSTANAPGISDHAMVVTDADIKPQYTFCKPRKLFKFGKANWQEIKKSCSDISNHVMEQVKSSSTNIENLWTYFKTNLLETVDKNVPSKMSRPKKSSPWINRNISKQLKKKSRLYRKAKSSGKWEKYRHFSKEVKKNIRKAEWNHVNNVIKDSLEENNTKPLFSYCKSKRQDNIGIAPLKSKGNLLTDAKSKANILIKQFVSVFTRESDNIVPEIGKHRNTKSAPKLNIDRHGVMKLLKNINIHKAMGPDGIPNILLKPVRKNCPSDLVPYSSTH